MTEEALRFPVAARLATYQTSSGADRAVQVYRPVTRAAQRALRFPAVVHVSGGGWLPCDLGADATTHKLLACHGVVSLVLEVCAGVDHRHPDAAVEVAAAVGWLRQNATELAVDVDRVMLIGTGAGAHAVAHAVADPTRRGLHDPPCAVLLDDPVLDPVLERREVDHMTRRDLDAYFGDTSSMADAALPGLVYDGAGPLPPLILSTGPNPALRSRLPVDELAHAWRRRGGFVARVEVEHDPVAREEHLLATVLSAVGLAPVKPRVVPEGRRVVNPGADPPSEPSR